MSNTPGLPKSKDFQLSLCWEHLQGAGGRAFVQAKVRRDSERLQPTGAKHVHRCGESSEQRGKHSGE